jgi:2-polyprenyl-3-methyl-5-hydroxy-6-metoxy-1,4-benzoquinol methylase
MSSAPQTQTPSVELIFDTLQAYHRTAALRGAIELDLFTAIAEGNTTSRKIAERIQASEKGTRILCDFLTVIGFLTKDQGQYALTVDSNTFLNRQSPAYLGGISRFLGNPELVSLYDDVANMVRKGGSARGDATLEPENPLWVEFARSMAPMMAFPAELIAKIIDAGAGKDWKVLDIAAGHGLFGLAIARQNPNAEIVALDWPAVLEVAKENAQKAGVANRYSTLPGSAFDVNFGSGYNVVLLTNFLHHFNPPANESLLKKVYAAMAPGGIGVTLDFVPNEDRISPPLAAAFSMSMLGSTPDGDTYTFAEYDRMFRNAGFAKSELRDISPSPQKVIVSYK